MKMHVMPTLIALTCLSAGAAADEASQPPEKPGTPLQLQVVLSRHQGEKTIASLPYVLSFNANSGREARVRAGIQVPLKFEGKEFPGNVVFKSVGTSVACSADALDGGRFKVDCGIELGSVFTGTGQQPGDGSVGTPPVLTEFSYKAALTLRDGQTAQYISAADPLSGELHRATVTLHVIK